MHPRHRSFRAGRQALVVIAALLAIMHPGCRRGDGGSPSSVSHPSPASDHDGRPAPTYRGDLVWGHESRSFTECGSGREGWVLDGTGGRLGEVYESLAVEPYQPIHVVVRGRWRPGSSSGFAADYSEQFEVFDLRRAEREGFGCREDLAGIDYVAYGHEPSWRAEIRRTGIVFSALGRFDRLEFPPPAGGRATEAQSFTSTREGEPPTRIEIVLTERTCVDSMSGSLFSFAATVRLDAVDFEGCAAAGW